MCKRNYPDEKEEENGGKKPNMECVRETPEKKKKEKNKHGMCKRNSPHKNKGSLGCVRGTPQMKKEKRKKEVSMGCVRGTLQIKMKPAWDVEEKLPTEK